MKMGFSSQRMEMFWTTKKAPMTSRANQKYESNNGLTSTCDILQNTWPAALPIE